MLFQWLFFSILLLCWTRWILMLALSFAQLLQHRRAQPSTLPSNALPISILVPAFNEETVIVRTLQRLLDIQYPSSFEIIVIDDGSTDQTPSLLQTLQEPRIRPLCLSQNQGKAHALNHGLKYARHPLVLVLDADTLLERNAPSLLEHHLRQPHISAVASNVKVGNRNNWLTLWQSIEYITSINIERRAQSFINCITTLPGAATLFRKEALLQIGGFSNQTVTEDTDATLSLLVAGHHLAYEDRAVAWTEAPHTLHDLYKQRLRWITGCLQCIWKHHKHWRHSPNLLFKLVGFPNFVFLNCILLLFFPLFLSQTIHLITHFSPLQIALFASLFAPDLLCSICGYLFDKEKISELRHFLPQRCFYMFFFGTLFLIVLLKNTLRIKQTWNKLPRSGHWMDTNP